MKILEEVNIEDLKDDKDLNYYEPGVEYVDLYHKDTFIGYIKVYLDNEENSREYICINSTIYYLDTIEKLNE